MIVTQPLGDEEPLLCHVPSQETLQFTGSVTANKVRFQHAHALKFIYITVVCGC